MTALPTLWVDYRDGSKDLLQPLVDMGLPAKEGDFDADIKFEGRGEKGASVTVAVEFKKLGELIQSLQTQRLQGHQLLKMQKYNFRYLLTEGEVLTDHQGLVARWARSRRGVRELVAIPGSMRLNELMKRIHVLHLRGGLNPLWADNRKDTLKHIEVLYRVWTDDDLDQHKSHLAIYQPPALLEVSQFRKTVSTLPDVGMRVSLAAEKRFGGSVRRAILAGAPEWAGIEIVDRNGGIKHLGTKSAEKIVEAIK